VACRSWSVTCGLSTAQVPLLLRLRTVPNRPTAYAWSSETATPVKSSPPAGSAERHPPPSFSNSTPSEGALPTVTKRWELPATDSSEASVGTFMRSKAEPFQCSVVPVVAEIQTSLALRPFTLKHVPWLMRSAGTSATTVQEVPL